MKVRVEFEAAMNPDRRCTSIETAQPKVGRDDIERVLDLLPRGAIIYDVHVDPDHEPEVPTDGE